MGELRRMAGTLEGLESEAREAIPQEARAWAEECLWPYLEEVRRELERREWDEPRPARVRSPQAGRIERGPVRLENGTRVWVLGKGPQGGYRIGVGDARRPWAVLERVPEHWVKLEHETTEAE